MRAIEPRRPSAPLRTCRSTTYERSHSHWFSLRHGRDRRPPERRQVDADERARRPESQHHVAQGADHAPSHHRHSHARRRAVHLRRYAGLPDQAQRRAEPVAEPRGDVHADFGRRDPVRDRSRPLRPRRPEGARSDSDVGADAADREQARPRHGQGHAVPVHAEDERAARVPRDRAAVGEASRRHQASDGRPSSRTCRKARRSTAKTT